MRYIETIEQQYHHSISQEGKIEWFGIRPKRIAEVHSVSEVLANPGTGLEGDGRQSLQKVLNWQTTSNADPAATSGSRSPNIY